MKSSEVVSWRSALRYLFRGDSRVKRARLAAVIACVAAPYLLGIVIMVIA